MHPHLAVAYHAFRELLAGGKSLQLVHLLTPLTNGNLVGHAYIPLLCEPA